ncbi:hypothetical protein J4425_00655 [Candidatus Woesearchaeota archaeon]|nr:hypothetical protein [Candidatus Woesearchaeota archaeon]
MKKIFGAILGLLLLVMLAGFASAADFEIVDVDVNGVDMDLNSMENPVLYVERGETLSIRAEIFANNSVNDMRLKAEIGGYEYDDIEETSDMFDLDEGVTRVQMLRLELPTDMQNNEVYTLRLKAYDRNDDVEAEFDLKVEAGRHLLSIQDVFFTPGLNVQSDQPLFVTVRVENMGDSKEEDVRVSASVPQLGIEQITYIDELASNLEENGDDEETSASSDALYLNLNNALPGIYDLIVEVSYNRGHDSITETYQVVVQGGQQPEELVISVDQLSKNVEFGQGTVYTISVANLGGNSADLTAQVSGLGSFANSRVDPEVVNVDAGSEAEMYVYVSPKEEGQKTFTIKVLQNGQAVKTFNVDLSTGKKSSEWGNVLNGLAIGFLVLLIILVILGIILAATRMSKKNNGEEPSGESYY